MSVTCKYLGMACEKVSVGGNTGPLSFTPEPGVGYAVFKMTESNSGDAQAAAFKMEAFAAGQLEPNVNNQRVRDALELFSAVETALANDGRIDGHEATQVLGMVAKLTHADEALQGLVGGLVGKFLGGK